MVQIRTHLLASDFSSSTRGERNNSYYANPTNALRIPWCLRSLSVETRKTQLHFQLSTVWQKLNYLPTWSNANLQLYAPMAENPAICPHGPMSTFNSMPQWQRIQLSIRMVQCQPSTDSFSKSSNSQPISSGHDVIHTPAPFPVCTQCLCTWTLNPNSSKPKETES